jgi:hypothetical protein
LDWEKILHVFQIASLQRALFSSQSENKNIQTALESQQQQFDMQLQLAETILQAKV